MAADSLGVLDALGAMPEQLAAAHEAAGMLVDRMTLPAPEDFDNVVIMGMGGSGIVGDLVQVVGTGTLPVPVVVLKQYRTPGFVGPRTLAFAVSYSGETEETVEMARGALDAGASLIVVTGGGALARLAEERGALHIPCTPGIPGPRFALCAMVAPVLVVMFRMGMLPEAHVAMTQAQRQLARRREQCKPDVAAPANPARELARRIGRTIPVIHGTGGLGAVAAMRWKQSINENAKAPAFWNAYPELDHNEICAWGQHGDVTRQILTLVSLRHGMEHERLEARMRLTQEIIEEAFVQVLEVEGIGQSRLAQLLDLAYLGDWTSCYLALDNDVDPGPIDAIAQLKSALSSPAQ
ncbi:MAG: bifunctional phosphoglucose/phosphomannose isomerase [Acidimicrobiia bacterium]